MIQKQSNILQVLYSIRVYACLQTPAMTTLWICRWMFVWNEAKPFSSDFDTQLDAAEKLYGIQLHFSFTPKDVCTELASLADYYPLEIRQRVEQIIRRQMRKYGYLMRS